MNLNLTIDKKEVLRYLHHKSDILDKNLDNTIEELIKETINLSRPRFTYNIFTLKKDNNTSNDILLEGTNLIFTGSDIKNHLLHSEKCAVMCATLGNEIETRIKYYSRIELLKSIILDACASTYIEALCDEVQKELENKASEEGLFITGRYSPGYGDFEISVQKSLLNIIEAGKKIGVTVTDSFIMLPRKSVSAVIGFQNKNIENKIDKCDSCNLKGTCDFRKENTYCGT